MHNNTAVKCSLCCHSCFSFKVTTVLHSSSGTLVSRFLVRRFFRPAVSQTQTEKTRSASACDASAANRSLPVEPAGDTMHDVSARKPVHLRYVAWNAAH